MTLRAVAHGVGVDVTSITGTANQITASSATGAVTLSLPSTISVSAGSPATVTVGSALAGDWSVVPGYVFLQNQALSVVAGNYALIQSNVGATNLNSPAGQVTQFTIGNALKATLSTSALNMASGIPYQLNATTGISATGAGAVALGNGTQGDITATLSCGAITTSGQTTYSAATAGPKLKQGANGLVGTFVANGATAVTVSNTNVAITDAIIISLNTVGGTPAGQPFLSAITAATSFAVKSVAGDTSTYNYAIIKNAP